MTSAATDLERFRAVVTRHLGLHFDDTRLAVLSEALERGLDAARETGAAYLERWERQGPSRDELRALAPQVTVGETYFFRNIEQLLALAEVTRLVHRPRLLSAGCASGEEPYSLAMMTMENQPSVVGIDVNPAALARAAHGIYSYWALRETPPDFDGSLPGFVAAGKEHAVATSVRAAVRFVEHNLVDDEPTLWRANSYDAIFCRNVLMYLVPEVAAAVVARFAGALAPGGYLFLGHAETLRGLSRDFDLRHTHGTFYSQLKDEAERRAGETSDAGPATSLTPLVDAMASSSWIATVQRSATRIEELSDLPSAASAAPARPAPAVADVSRALELLKRERFADALVALGEPPHGGTHDPDLLLLRAVLLTLSGRISDAEQVCAELRHLDPLSAGAHYLLALCREGAGDATAAEEHNRAAAYLDPTFAMPRLHLGLLARRRGDLGAARCEIERALDLLVREDPSRVLLFGGGFSREAITQMCRAELGAIGGGR